MSKLPLVLLHGWSDDSKSFRPLADWLKQNGFNVVDIYLGDYLSMNDEITLFDLGAAFSRALKAQNISERRFGFDLIVHSTGGLVAREYLRQVCQGDARKTPIQHLCMLAPANFGSPLARLGKSVVGRLFKGWDWDHLGQTGEQVLNALELASPYSWSLARADLFDPGFPIFDASNCMVTVLVGTTAYGNKLRAMVHENGSDGTVRVATANLNARRFRLDFGNPSQPTLAMDQPNCGEIAFGVLHRDHTTIHDPNATAQAREWSDLMIGSLTVEPKTYAKHVATCQGIKEATFAAGMNGRNKDWFHQYQHVVFHVHDQFGHGIRDYVVEFYQEENDRADKVFRKIHGEILEKVTANSVDPSYRSFLFDTTDLKKFLQASPSVNIEMSVSAANISERIGFRNSDQGVSVFSRQEPRFLFPNEPVLVEVTLYRDPSPEVFRLTKA